MITESLPGIEFSKCIGVIYVRSLSSLFLLLPRSIHPVFKSYPISAKHGPTALISCHNRYRDWIESHASFAGNSGESKSAPTVYTETTVPKIVPIAIGRIAFVSPMTKRIARIEPKIIVTGSENFIFSNVVFSVFVFLSFLRSPFYSFRKKGEYT